ncbi:HEPN domain-containing protein [Puteibacter caeruleilacunae]|nr:HEPN domain-containing protein [Puteibacter caeruleilacunae]
MKHKLDSESIKALSEYRIQRAFETLAEATTLMDNGYHNAAINRLYYACYYAVNSLLIKNKITANTHSGVKQMFGLHFIVTKKISTDMGRFYNQLFNDRLSGDYDDFITFNEEILKEIYPKADEFVRTISNLLKD